MGRREKLIRLPVPFEDAMTALLHTKPAKVRGAESSKRLKAKRKTTRQKKVR